MEGSDFLPTDAPGHYRNMIEMRLFAHGRERGISTVLAELGGKVPLPQIEHGLLIGRKI
jgi:hypothetical protein